MDRDIEFRVQLRNVIPIPKEDPAFSKSFRRVATNPSLIWVPWLRAAADKDPGDVRPLVKADL
jgi:hypothetical protein